MRRVLLLLVLLLAACIKVDPAQQGMASITGTAGAIEPIKELTSTEPPKEPKPVLDIPIKRVKVGETVSFPNLEATDPDGDTLTYTFEEPLSEQGAWKTGPGDEGTYETTITVSDGKSITKQAVRIIVESLNAPPELQGVEDIKVREGDTLRLDIRAIDPDQDKVKISFDGWQTQFPYTTTYKDAGLHTVKVIARDGTHTVEQLVTITVEDVNRPPVIHRFDDVLVMEGDEVIVRADADDPDGDKLTFTFSSPLDANGTWLTKKGDHGVYRVNVSVSDGVVHDATDFRIVVEPLNRPPIIKSIDDVTVKEGDLVRVKLDAEDPEKEQLQITWHGWMLAEEKRTGFDDAGEHLVTVSVSDEYHEINESFRVTVENVNRAPKFVTDAFE